MNRPVVWIVNHDRSADVPGGVLGVYRRKADALAHAADWRRARAESGPWHRSEYKGKAGSTSVTWSDELCEEGLEVWAYRIREAYVSDESDESQAPIVAL